MQRVIDLLRGASTDTPPVDTTVTDPPDTTQDTYVAGLPSWRQGSNAIPEDWQENPDGTWTHLQTGTLWDENGYPLDLGVDDPIDYVPPDERPDDYQPQPNPWQPDTQYPNYPGINNPYRPDYIPPSTPPPTGVAPPRVNMPTPPGTGGGGSPPGGPFPGMNTPPPGQISGPSRIFSPFGEPLGVFSAPRTYGGLPRSTGPWGIPGGWYDGQAAQANALRGQ
jgi:hypothetical protein